MFTSTPQVLERIGQAHGLDATPIHLFTWRTGLSDAHAPMQDAYCCWSQHKRKCMLRPEHCKRNNGASC